MAVKTLYGTNNLLGAAAPKWGELAEASPGATATSSPVMGWTVGTATPTKYKDADAANVRSAPTSATESPDATINNGGGTNNAGWRTKEKLKGKFAAGKWVIHMPCIATVKGGSQDVAIMVKLWKGTAEAGTGATAINATPLTCSTLTNLTTEAQQDSTAELELPELNFGEGEYLFIEVAVKIVGAGAEATCDCVFRYGNEGVRIVTTNFTEGGAKPAELPLGPAVGAASTSLALNAPTRLPLEAAVGAASTALTLTVPSKAILPLGPAVGAASTSLQLRAPSLLQLGAAVGAASTSLTLTAPSKVASRIAVARENPPDRLAVIVRDPETGVPIGRWAEDEPLVENVFSGLTKSGEMPGGHKEMSVTLSRDPRLSWPDFPTYAPIEVQAAGGEKVFEGYLQRKPASDGDHVVIQPAAAGYQKMLEDDQGQIGPAFINSDLSKWTGPSVARRLALSAANAPSQQDPSVNWGPNGPALRLEVQGRWEAPIIPFCEAWFDAGSGARVAALYGDWANGDTNTLFELYFRFADDDAATTDEGSGEAYGATSGHISQAPAVPRRYVRIPWNYSSTPAGADGGQYGVDLQNLKVAADHGLPLQGTWPLQGLYAGQMLLYAIPRFTPLEATEESVEDDGFLIMQAWYNEPGPASNWVNDLNKYALLDWFVLNGRLFERRFPGTYGRKWQAYAGPSGLKKAGEDGTRLWDMLTVMWQDVDGSTKTAGALGSGMMFEDSRLEVTDPDHPAVKARELYGPNFNRRNLLKLNGICTTNEAIAVAARFLAELNQLDHSGEATLSGYVKDDKGNEYPASYVMPGDEVRFPDAADTSYRKITANPYTRDSLSCNVTLDAPKEGIAALQERFNARLESLELGA